MFVAPAILEARDASHNAQRRDKEIQARQIRAPPGATTPVQETDDGDIISMILSGIFGPIGNDETTTSTKSTRTTSTRTSTSTSTRSTSTSTSTSTTPVVVTTPPPVVVSTPSSTRRTTTIVTQTVDTSANNAANAPSKPAGLPSVVIGVIVAAAVIFGLIFIALIARKVFQAKRRRRRATWAENGGISPFQDPLVREKALPPPPPPETQDYVASYPAYPPAAVTFANQPAPYSPAAASSAGYPAPYPFGGAGYSTQANGGGSTTTAAMFQSSAYAPADLAGPVVIQQTPPTPIAGSTMPMPAANAQLSVVKRTFIPSLPDELSIANGEQVRVLSSYDDGWALCEKLTTGEKGVVPQECLESAQSTASNTPAQQLAGSEESARLNRNSSLRRGREQTY